MCCDFRKHIAPSWRQNLIVFSHQYLINSLLVELHVFLQPLFFAMPMPAPLMGCRAPPAAARSYRDRVDGGGGVEFGEAEGFCLLDVDIAADAFSLENPPHDDRWREQEDGSVIFQRFVGTGGLQILRLVLNARVENKAAGACWRAMRNQGLALPTNAIETVEKLVAQSFSRRHRVAAS